MNLITILGLLFLSLIILVVLLEKFGNKEASEQQAQSMSRWVMPLLGVLILVQAIAFFMKG